MEDRTNNAQEYYVVTEDQIREKARSYVPAKEKQRFVEDVSTRCFDIMNISATTGDTATPPLYKENTLRKQKYLAAAVAKLYLGEGFTPANEDDPWLMTDEDFDYFSVVRPITQVDRIRRFSKDHELQDKCYDLVQDYKDLREMLNSEIHGLMRAMNDTLARFQNLLAVQASPEYLESLKGELDSLQTEIAEHAEAIREEAQEGV